MLRGVLRHAGRWAICSLFLTHTHTHTHACTQNPAQLLLPRFNIHFPIEHQNPFYFHLSKYLSHFGYKFVCAGVFPLQ